MKKEKVVVLSAKIKGSEGNGKYVAFCTQDQVEKMKAEYRKQQTLPAAAWEFATTDLPLNVLMKDSLQLT